MNKVVDGDEVVEVFTFAELEKRYPARSRVKLKGGCVCLSDRLGEERSYDFALDRIDSPMKLVSWLYHLGGKAWFDGWMQQELIEKVCKHFGWEIPYGV